MNITSDGVRPLASTVEKELFGEKSVNLGEMLRAGLPVPDGYALSWEFARRISEGDVAALERALKLGDALPDLLAVRSSAVGEDSAGASFAGQHLTMLGVKGARALVAAILQVERSGGTQWAQAYRQAKGDVGYPRVAVTVQKLLAPEAAGVMFTRNPITGATERVVEGAWGLGEAVVSSRVTPDTYRVAPGGECLSKVASEKSLSLHPIAGGGVEERRVPPEKAGALCLTDKDLLALDQLATNCEQQFGGPQDVEWAKAEGRIWLLQSRPITVAGSSAA